MALSVMDCLPSVVSRRVRVLSNFLFLLRLLFVTASPLFAQQPPSDPQAVAYAGQSIAAITGGNTIYDVTLTGNITWGGSTKPETGSVVLLALGTGESRMDMSLPSGMRSEIRDASTGVAQGEWVAPNGTSGLFSLENCATDAVWFFPALGSLARGTNIVLLYIGQETRNGVLVQHIQSYVYQPNPGGENPTPQHLSTMDFYLDIATLVPVSITYNAHPDNGATTDLPVEIKLFDYQNVNGVLVPTHIQRLLQGNLTVDISISGAAFNTGLPLSEFAIN